jgi:hypothetical protein
MWTFFLIIFFFFLRRPEKMSVNSDASIPHLCYCGVHARLRYSWTSDNPGRKWYGCIKYKVILKLISFDLFFLLVVYDIYLFSHRKLGIVIFFKWADKKMTSYEKRLEEHMRDMEEGRRADIEEVEKKTMANIDRLEKLIETKHKEQYERLRLELGLCQNNRKIFWSAVVIILGIVIYFSSYSGSEVSYLMLE